LTAAFRAPPDAPYEVLGIVQGGLLVYYYNPNA
jgi:hypothetical protein